MIDDWQNNILCLEDDIKPVANSYISFQGIYNHCLEADIMIDEDATFEQFGYYSNTLSFGSHKSVVAICDGCGKVRVLPKFNYADLCKQCRMKTPETRLKISQNHVGMQGRKHSVETIKRMSGENNPMFGVRICGENHHMFGKHHTEETKYKLSEVLIGENNPNYGKKFSEERKRRISAGKQKISYEEWENYVANAPYCLRFDEICRESNREKYNRECFICGLPESENITSKGQHKKLSVHHVDMNKNQGCDSNDWKLIPVCIHCHNQVHHKKMESYITYILKNGTI